MPVVRGPSMAVPDPHMHAAPIVPDAESGGFPVSPGTYIVHGNTSGQDAGTAVQPTDLSIQRDARKHTYWRGLPGTVGQLMDDNQIQYATRSGQTQGTRQPLFAPLPGRPGTAPMPPPERSQNTQSTFKETARYDQNWGRELTGRHFSMASNIRAYPIGGQQPMHRMRNTFRLEPPPIDTRMTDLPPGGGVQRVESQNITSKRSPFRSPF